ncbi:MAG: hypothetical protein VW728_12085, partial [Paracoccaceae bacterium]
MDQSASATSALSLKDKAILAMVRFFRAEWSGALLAILILAISIESIITPIIINQHFDSRFSKGFIDNVLTIKIIIEISFSDGKT